MSLKEKKRYKSGKLEEKMSKTENCEETCISDGQPICRSLVFKVKN